MKNKCYRCEKELPSKQGWYLQAFQRGNLENRANFMLCDGCVKWFERMLKVDEMMIGVLDEKNN